MKKVFMIVILSVTMAQMALGQSRCLTPEFEEARLKLYEAFGGPKEPSGILFDVTLHDVGDTMSFWTWDLSRMPPIWIQVPATCQAVTEYSYVFVADDQWNINMDSSDVADVTYYWEEATYNDSSGGIYQMDTENFGPPPDELDNDDHIYIFYSALGSYNGVVFDGYFSVFNQYTEDEAQEMGGHSNEVEMFYMSCHPGNPVSPIRLSVLAHEFEHMIHWAHDPDEATWVDEGCAEYAMLLFGVPDPLIDFPTHPDDDLTVWDNTFADYIQTFMFFTYLADHYGGPPTLREVVAEPQNSTHGVEAVLQNLGYEETFADVFVNWVIANYYHGGRSEWEYPPDSLYLYYSIEPPAFSHSDIHEDYPLGPNSRHVNHWAADYIKFENSSMIPRLNLYFEGDMSADFGLALFSGWFPFGFAGERVFPEDNVWQGGFENTENFLYATLMVSGLGSYGTANYQYSADITTDIEEQVLPDHRFSLGPSYPNPFNAATTIYYSLPETGSISLSVFNLLGQRVATLFEGIQQAGEHGITWDASAFPSGVYFAKLEAGDYSESLKLVLLK